jgi:ankyrin repeat protein
METLVNGFFIIEDSRAIFDAIMEDDIELLSNSLQRGPTAAPPPDPPLMRALAGGINPRNLRPRTTLLEFALQHNKWESVKFLISVGAHLDDELFSSVLDSIVDDNNTDMLQFMNETFPAKMPQELLKYYISKGKITELRLALQDERSKAAMRDNYDLMIQAINGGNPEIVNILIQNGFRLDSDEAVNARGDRRLRYLICAVHQGNRDIVRLFLRPGVNFDNGFGDSILY